MYERFQNQGRMLPAGLHYVDSWLEKDDRCFQLTETDSPHLFNLWMDYWKDLVSFQIIELESKKPGSPGAHAPQ